MVSYNTIPRKKQDVRFVFNIEKSAEAGEDYVSKLQNICLLMLTHKVLAIRVFVQSFLYSVKYYFSTWSV